MLFPADHVLTSVQREINQLQRTINSTAEGSVLQAMHLALRLVTARERGGIDAISAQWRRLEQLLTDIERLLPSTEAWTTQTDSLQESVQAGLREQAVARSEAGLLKVLAEVQKLAADIAKSKSIEETIRLEIGAKILQWECDDLRGQLDGESPASSTAAEITLEVWRDYLRDRFSEPTLEVTAFKSLAGGFGKQTYLFDTVGDALNGAYVLRRDMAVTLFDNDCHRIEKEYALIRAVHGRGFPAPEAIWLDTAHRLIPGGHFLVMRRSPGVSGGSVFQAKGRVPEDLAETLARILAGLHQLPPLTELGSLTESIQAELWGLSIRDVVTRYLMGWRDLFDREVHLPSPAIASLFGWLLDHVPEAEGSPCLLHGDIGFHNFLFDEGRLTTVLDWEFGHVGDPAEDLAYVQNTLGEFLDWGAFMRTYRAAGGPAVGIERLKFFRVWGHLRNACAANMVSAKFQDRQVDDLKLVLLPHIYIPQFLAAAQAAIQALDDAFDVGVSDELL